jgi:subtilisin family serine protease
MSLRSWSYSLAAAAFAALAPPSPIAADSRGEPAQVVFRLRAPGDADAVAAARLGPAAGRARRLFDRSPGARSGALDRTYVVPVPDGLTAERAATQVAADPRVAFAQPDFERETHGGSWGQLYADDWGLEIMRVARAWPLSRGRGVVVAVVDSGVDVGHAAISGHVWSNPEESGGSGPGNGFPDDFYGWDFVANDNQPIDEHGHGTHVAGLVVGGPGGSPAREIGVAPEARVMAIRVANGAGSATSSRVASGLVYAADNGAHVVTLPSGCVARCPADPVVEAAVRYAMAKGAIVVASAGNRGDDVRFYSPQNMTNPKPIVVTASNELDQRASFSNYGDLVDVGAPGGGTNAPSPVQATSNVLSAAAELCAPIICAPAVLVDGPGPYRYLRRAGTSASAAHVAGVIALLLGEEPSLQLEDLRERLYGNATDRGPRWFDPTFGLGRVSAEDAVGDLRHYIHAHVAVPAEGATVSGVVRIAGTAISRAVESIQVEVGPAPFPTYSSAGVVPVAHPVAFGDLASWDTTGLAPGPWVIRVTVVDRLPERREFYRTVNVVADGGTPRIVLDVVSEHSGTGTVRVDPVDAFCDGLARTTQTCTYVPAPGTSVTLTAVPAPTSSFVGWSGACRSADAVCVVPVDDVRYVRAAFAGPFRLGVEVLPVNGGIGGPGITPPGTSCGVAESPCVYTYAPGTVVRLDQGDSGPIYSFSWQGPPCAGVDPCFVTMDRDLTLRSTVRFHGSSGPLVDAGVDRRVVAGTPVLVAGFASSPNPPVTVTWRDLTTGTVLGNEPQIAALFAFGVHEVELTAVDAAGETASDTLIVVAHER